MAEAGIIPAHGIANLIEDGKVRLARLPDADQIQPASLDLRLGAIAYRVHKGFTHAEVALSAGVQRMVTVHGGCNTRFAKIYAALTTAVGYPALGTTPRAAGMSDAPSRT